MTILYGISNCDTIKKARKWLEANDIPYQFHDYKKQSIDASFLERMIKQHGLDIIINKRGTTYRQLSPEQKEALERDATIALLVENTSMIKRPILTTEAGSWVGFKAEKYAEIFDLK